MTMDDKIWRGIVRNVEALDKLTVRAGIIGNKAHEAHADSDLSNVEIAMIHEMGTSRIPARPFVSAAFETPKARSELAQLQAKAATAILAGRMTAERALKLIGVWAQGTIQSYVTEHNIPPPLAPATIASKARKRSSDGATESIDRPLVDTGQMIGAVTWEVK